MSRITRRALALALTLTACSAATAAAFIPFYPIAGTAGSGETGIGTQFDFFVIAGFTTGFGGVPVGDISGDTVGGIVVPTIEPGVFGGATFVNPALKPDLRDRSGPVVCFNANFPTANRAIFGVADDVRGKTVYRIFYVEDNASPSGTPDSAFGTREVTAAQPDRMTMLASTRREPSFDCDRNVPRRGTGGPIAEGDLQIASIDGLFAVSMIDR
jgi:hypothetical protein